MFSTIYTKEELQIKRTDTINSRPLKLENLGEN